MKFIDDKGKIFGKINFFDFLIVLFLIFLTPLLYYGNKALSKRTIPKDLKIVLVTVKFTSIIPELANVLREGDNIKDSNGDVTGVLKKVISTASSEAISINRLNTRVNEYVMVSNPFAKDVVCLFELDCIEEKGSLLFNGYAVKIGSGVVFSSDNYDAQGIVIRIDRTNLVAKKKE